MEAASNQTERENVSTLKEDSPVTDLGEKGGKVQQHHDLFVWDAPARPFKRRNREFYITTVAIAVVVGLILFVAEGAMPVLLLISLIFLFYVMNTVEPDSIRYKITNKGLVVANSSTDFTQMVRFWFSRRFDSELLVVQTNKLPGRMELVINPQDKEEIKKQLSHYLLEEEVPPSFIDKAANWFSKRLPLG